MITKICRGPFHSEGKQVSIDDFNTNQSGVRKNQIYSMCKRCRNEKNRIYRHSKPGYNRDATYVPIEKIYIFLIEIINRVGFNEAARRIGIGKTTAYQIKNRGVKFCTLKSSKLIIQTLYELRKENIVRNPYSIKRGSQARGEEELASSAKQNFNSFRSKETMVKIFNDDIKKIDKSLSPDLIKAYGTQKLCIDRVIVTRWGSKKEISCIHCGSLNIKKSKKERCFANAGFRCKICKKEFSAISGTIFFKTRTPLIKYFILIQLVRDGYDVRKTAALSKKLNLTYRSCRSLTERVVDAMKTEEREFLLKVIQL